MGGYETVRRQAGEVDRLLEWRQPGIEIADVGVKDSSFSADAAPYDGRMSQLAEVLERHGRCGRFG